MPNRQLAVIILAAGQGTRMKSDLHKVLHPIAGKAMLHHILDKTRMLGAAKTILVLGAYADQLEQSVAGYDGIETVMQNKQLGTGHAVMQARAALDGFDGDVLVLFGDVPLISSATMAAMIARLNAADNVRSVVLGFRPDDPLRYGRIIANGQGEIEKMVEYKDATEAERRVTLCNAGPLAARAAEIFILLDQLTNDNAAGEYYLPDVVMMPGGKSAVVETGNPREVAGVNSRAELAQVERWWQEEKRAEILAAGVTMNDPNSVWFAHDTQIAADVTIEPNVIFGANVRIESGATIKGHSHIEGAHIGEDCSVGPFARLRPGSVMDKGAKIGNFVEMKQAHLGEGAKASHLTYLGDALIGKNANIGAGTICCNYDGYFKYQTEIGEGAFIGSNSALIAPLKIGRGAIVAAGSALSVNVPDDALAMVRGAPQQKSGWAGKFRNIMQARKDKQK